ncbi:MAG: VOC family protein [Phycisphaerales bacterium]
MSTAVTHFEIYGENPAVLANFYRESLGWQVEQMPGINYWRIHTGAEEGAPLHGGLTYRALPGLNGWMLFVNVASLDETVERIQSLGGSVVRRKTAIPRTAWVTIVADPANNIFGIWQSDPHAFPMPEPD